MLKWHTVWILLSLSSFSSFAFSEEPVQLNSRASLSIRAGNWFEEPNDVVIIPCTESGKIGYNISPPETYQFIANQIASRSLQVGTAHFISVGVGKSKGIVLAVVPTDTFSGDASVAAQKALGHAFQLADSAGAKKVTLPYVRFGTNLIFGDTSEFTLTEEENARVYETAVRRYASESSKIERIQIFGSSRLEELSVLKRGFKGLDGKCPFELLAQ